MSPTPLPSFTVFDVETTGLDPSQGHRIIEIAGIRIENGEIDETRVFTSLVNPERPIPWDAQRIHKITDEEVKQAPGIEAVLPKFLEFASGSLLVAHNAQFDMSFLRNEKSFCWGYIDLPECLCTMCLSRAVHPNEFGHSLDAVAKRLHLTIPKTLHRALPDVILTAHALMRMVEKAELSLDRLREIAGIRARV